MIHKHNGHTLRNESMPVFYSLSQYCISSSIFATIFFCSAKGGSGISNLSIAFDESPCMPIPLPPINPALSNKLNQSKMLQRIPDSISLDRGSDIGCIRQYFRIRVPHCNTILYMRKHRQVICAVTEYITRS